MAELQQGSDADMAKPKAASAGVSKEVRPVLEAIGGLIDGFCRDHLNDEYTVLCHKLAEKLARKQPAPSGASVAIVIDD